MVLGHAVEVPGGVPAAVGSRDECDFSEQPWDSDYGKLRRPACACERAARSKFGRLSESNHRNLHADGPHRADTAEHDVRAEIDAGRSKILASVSARRDDTAAGASRYLQRVQCEQRAQHDSDI